MKVLVTAGPTQEAIDPVRYITNHSSGKMGYSIAKACMLRGADVTLVTGRTALDAPLFVNTVPIVSAKDMYEEVTSRSQDMDIIIKAAAVADYRPCNVSDEKIKKKDGDVMSIHGRYSEISRRTQETRPVLMRLFYGDTEHAGELQEKAGEKESGYDRCQ